MKLQEVERLASSLGLPLDLAFSCETCSIFYSQHISVLMKKFRRAVESSDRSADVVSSNFPFSQFFSDSPSPLFCGDFEADLRAAEGCMAHLDQM